MKKILEKMNVEHASKGKYTWEELRHYKEDMYRPRTYPK